MSPAGTTDPATIFSFRPYLLPVGLTVFRLLLAPLCVALAASGVAGWPWLAILPAALMSDLFDGMAARRLGVSTPWVRRFDSGTDVAFYLSVVASLWLLREEIVREYAVGIAAVLGLEVVCNGLSLARFGRWPATHTYLAKGWAVLLAAAFAVVLAFGAAWPLFDLMIVTGVLVDLEVIAIMLASRSPPVDVPTLWHALRTRATP